MLRPGAGRYREARCAGLLGVPRPLQRGALPLLRASVCVVLAGMPVGLVRAWHYQDALWSCGHVLWGVALSLHPSTYPSPSSEPSQPVSPITASSAGVNQRPLEATPTAGDLWASFSLPCHPRP